MIRVALAAILLLVLMVAMVFAGEIKEIKTPSGLTVLYSRMPGQKNVAMGFLMPGGQAVEPMDKPLAADVAVSALTSGADGMTEGEIVETASDLNMGVAFSINAEYVSGIFLSPLERVDESIPFANRIITKPDFPEDKVRLTIENLVKNVESARNTIEGKGQFKFVELFAKPHPYGVALMGDVKRLQAVKREDVIAWHKERFVRNGLVVSIAGDVDEQTAAKLVDGFFAGLPEGAAPGPIPDVEFNSLKSDLVKVNGDTDEQVFLWMVGKTPAGVQGPSAVAASMLQEIFSGGQGSRLFAELRDKDGATYGLNGMCRFFEKAGFHVLAGNLAKKSLDKSLADISQAWAKFREEGPTPDEIKALKQKQIDRAVQAQKEAAPFAYFMLDGRNQGLTLQQINDYAGLINDLDLTDKSLRQAIFDKTPLSIIVE